MHGLGCLVYPIFHNRILNSFISICGFQGTYAGHPVRTVPNGDGEIRTLDPLLARQVLSQLSYTPMDAGLSFRTSLPVFSFVCSLSGLGLSEPFPISLRLWMNFTCFSLLGVGLSGLEPPTSRLSGVRSNQLSYKPIGIRQPPAFPCRLQHSIIGRLSLNHRVRDGYGCFP